MPRSLPLALAVALSPAMAFAQTYTGIYWQLLAIDGKLTETRATLRIDVDNVLAGAAPCNRWSAGNALPLPALALGGIRATRMACDKLADEQTFFDSLSLMTTVQPDGDQTLILTGADGRSMEFVREATDSTQVCKTCNP